AVVIVAGAVLVILRLLVTPVSAAQMDTRTTGVVMESVILPHKAVKAVVIVAGAVLVILRLLVTPVSAAQMDTRTTGVVMESVILPHQAMVVEGEGGQPRSGYFPIMT
ncbi:MAG: hypothetical protein WB564_04505, partial [Dehalococcoidia bacterium]